MRRPGIDVRPLRTATGDADFCEIFFDDVHVPASALLGPVDQGWMVAMATLTFERSGVTNLHIPTRRKVAELIAETQRVGRADDPVVRQQLTRLWTQAEVQRLLSEQATARAPGRTAAGTGGQPHQAGVEPGEPGAPARARHAILGLDALDTQSHAGRWGHQAVSARSLSIAGGTTEGNKNIVAERVPRAPRDPR